METKVLHPEIKFRTSRSSGSGGQHVNKVETQVELLFDVEGSVFLTETQKIRIAEALKNRIDQTGVLHLTNGSTRSQLRNKQLVLQQFDELIGKALRPRPRRKPVKKRQADPEKRLKWKKKQSEKKALRGKILP